MAEGAGAINKGYLREDFRLFHLRDRRCVPVETHFHDFDKVVILCAGSVDYTVEGVCYKMRPGEVLFVRHHDVHRPVISPDEDYERIILWIRPQTLELSTESGGTLGECFDRASESRACLYRPAAETWKHITALASGLEQSLSDGRFGSELMSRGLFLQLMVELARCVLLGAPQPAAERDGQLDAAVSYISRHISEPISVDRLAGLCFLSRYYFMRRFKELTGYTVHGYINLKRMTEAARLLSSGATPAQTAAGVGFSDYSSFLRAFRKQYGVAPGEFARNGAPVRDSGYTE